ncbi:MAG: hypothetical protein LC800_21220 [Acidobacteria bacterium]|nr:hypothetical protein [Acidobacteriota bacterium]
MGSPAASNTTELSYGGCGCAGGEVVTARDTVGQVTEVLGTNAAGQPTYAGVEKYAKELKYRAFGAIKSMNYNNGRSLATQFDARLRLKRWDVAGVLGYDYSYDKFAENSFRVAYAQNISHNGTAGGDATLNRSYDYDHAGRLWEAHTGSGADAHAAGQAFPAATGPYSHSYRYDRYGNQTYRVGWGGWYGSYLSQYQTYTNNRRDGLTYDAAGNLTNDGAQYTYDATGQQTSGVYPAGWGGHAGRGARATPHVHPVEEGAAFVSDTNHVTVEETEALVVIVLAHETGPREPPS